MQKEGEVLKFTWQSQSDAAILQSVRYGLRLNDWNGKITEEEERLAKRIDEWKRAEPGSSENIITMTVEEAKIALSAIDRNYQFEVDGGGVMTDTIVTSLALPEIKSFVSGD